jgi:hypothetical protein
MVPPVAVDPPVPVPPADVAPPLLTGVWPVLLQPVPATDNKPNNATPKTGKFLIASALASLHHTRGFSAVHVDFLQQTWCTIALAMKTSTLVAFIALFGLLGLFTSGCSDSSLSCSEVDSGAADGGADLASGTSAVGIGLDAPGLADAADAPAVGGAGVDGGADGLDLGSVAGDGPGDDGGLDLGSVAGDGPGDDGGLDLGSVAGDGPVEAGGIDSGAPTDAGSVTD